MYCWFLSHFDSSGSINPDCGNYKCTSFFNIKNRISKSRVKAEVRLKLGTSHYRYSWLSTHLTECKLMSECPSKKQIHRLLVIVTRLARTRIVQMDCIERFAELLMLKDGAPLHIHFAPNQSAYFLVCLCGFWSGPHLMSFSELSLEECNIWSGRYQK